MAKQASSRSKGFRKYKPEQKHLTADQWKKIGIAAAAVVVVIVLVCVFYNDGSLKVKDGKVVTAGDNWLVVNTTDSKTSPKYFKLGEIEAAEGFALDGVSSVTDENEFMYTFKPVDPENCAADSYFVVAVDCDYKEYPDQGKEKLAGYMTDFVATDTEYAQIGGMDVSYYYYTMTKMDENNESATGYTESMLAYVSSLRKGCSVMLSVDNELDKPEDAVGQAALQEVLNQAVAGVTLAK